MIALRIQGLRAQNGYTQTALAKKLGLTRSSVNAWEIGFSTPSTMYVVKLAKTFKVSTDYILGIDSEENLDISKLKTDQKYTLTLLTNQYERCNAILNAAGISSSMDDQEIVEILTALREAADSRRTSR